MSVEQDSGPGADLEARIDAIEAGYEFLLAYAAQGRKTDRAAGEGHKVREFLGNMAEALSGLGAVTRAQAEQRDGALVVDSAAFFDAVDDDASKSLAVIRLVLAQADISSQLVENLNASIHVRALITDLWIVDEALKNAGSA